MITSSPRQLRSLLALMIATIAFSHVHVYAHDLWIEPSTFSPVLGQRVAVKLRVGENLVGEALVRDPSLINQFVVVDAEGRKPIGGRVGDDPAGFLRVSTPGMLVIGYYSNPSAVELPVDKFIEYLKEEGLEAIVAQRARRKDTGTVVREHFSRCAKSLVLSGTPDEAQGDRILGFTLELLAERNPYTLRADEELPLRLTYESRPLAGALVVAINRQNPAQKLSARTDNEGRVRFRLPHRGMWLIKAVHMVRAPLVSKAEWTSFWASLTFELRAAN